MISHFRGSENNDLSTSESKSDEWLDRLHSGAIWGDSRAIGLRISSIGQGQGLTEILKDIEQIVSKQCFLINDKVRIQFIKHVNYIQYVNGFSDIITSFLQPRTLELLTSLLMPPFIRLFLVENNTNP